MDKVCTEFAYACVGSTLRSAHTVQPLLRKVFGSFVVGICWIALHRLESLRASYLGQGMPFTPMASDGLGRRSSIVIGSVIMLGGVTMQACAKHVGTLIGARVISEFPITFCSTATRQLAPNTSRIRPFVRPECGPTTHR